MDTKKIYRKNISDEVMIIIILASHLFKNTVDFFFLAILAKLDPFRGIVDSN